MREYLLMGYSTYYPEGGVEEIIGKYSNIEEAREGCDDDAIEAGGYYRCNYEIIDLHNLEVVLWGDAEIDWKEGKQSVYWFDDVRNLVESRRQQKVINNV